jgi:hypothetical protein
VGKRKNKRKKKRRLPLPLPASLPTPPLPRTGFQPTLRALGRFLGWFIAALALVIGLLQAYPWLSIQEGAMLNPANPYSELFTISNQGYIPLTDLDARCTINLATPHGSVSNSGATYTNCAGYLSHGIPATIPCFRMISATQIASGSRLDVTISYAFYHLAGLRRHQTFHFQNIVGSDNIPHWISLAP